MLDSALLFVANRSAVASRDSKCLFTMSHTLRIVAVEATEDTAAWQLLDVLSLVMLLAPLLLLLLLQNVTYSPRACPENN